MDCSYFDKLNARHAQKRTCQPASGHSGPSRSPSRSISGEPRGQATPPPTHPKVATDTDAVPDELQEEPQQEQHLRSAASLPWQERRERSDAAARSNSEYVESAPHERLAALQSVIQTAISEDWQHHACASGATRLEDPPPKPLQVMQVEYISMQDRFKLMLPCYECASCNQSISVPQDGYVHCVAGDACNKPSSYAGVAKATCDLEQHTDTYLDRRVGGRSATALYCNMRTAEQFVYYLLAVALLLRQCCGMLHMSHLYIDFACQFQWASGKGQAPTWLPSISLSANMAQLQLRGVRGPHEQRMAAAKLKCMELETAHALEKETHLGSAEGESPLIARGLVLLVEGQVTRYRTQVEQLTNDVHELGLQRDHMGQSDKARAQQATPSRQSLGSASQRGSTLPGVREW
ncbi:hypothetical protein QJQ45_012764 [Haematococcus lacustris]|nr:hypothetical protein QJQ45_012764 [Haematococcus lacustris]